MGGAGKQVGAHLDASGLRPLDILHEPRVVEALAVGAAVADANDGEGDAVGLHLVPIDGRVLAALLVVEVRDIDADLQNIGHRDNRALVGGLLAIDIGAHAVSRRPRGAVAVPHVGEGAEGGDAGIFVLLQPHVVGNAVGDAPAVSVGHRLAGSLVMIAFRLIGGARLVAVAVVGEGGRGDEGEGEQRGQENAQRLCSHRNILQLSGTVHHRLGLKGFTHDSIFVFQSARQTRALLAPEVGL